MTSIIKYRHVEVAFNLGYAAAKEARGRASAGDRGVIKLIAAKSDAIMDILNSWYAGYDRCRDEDVAALFPDDEYFQNKLK